MPDVTDMRLRFLEDAEAAWIYANHPEVGRSPDDYCPTCDKRGTYRWAGEEHACDCEDQLQRLKHYLAAGIGTAYQRLTWHDLNNDALVGQVEKYVTNQEYMRRGIGLFLIGDVGVGKTLVGTLCLKDFVTHGYSCFAVEFAEMIDMYASSWRSKEERERFHRKVIGSQVLLLDDVGREMRRNNDLPEATFDLVLRTRVRHGRSTIVTTNMEPEELGTGYGAPVLSLLREKSITIRVGGEDWRRKAREREVAEIENGETRPIR